MSVWENLVFVVAVKAGPTLMIATTAGVGVEVEARGVTVTTEAEVTPGGPGGSLTRERCQLLWALGLSGDRLHEEKAQSAQDRNSFLFLNFSNAQAATKCALCIKSCWAVFVGYC